MSSSLGSFITEKVLGDRSAVRLFEGVSRFCVDVVQIHGVSFLGNAVGLEPIQKELKALDAAIYLNNFFKGIGDTIAQGYALAGLAGSFATYYVGLNAGCAGTASKIRQDSVKFLYAANKSIGDGFAGAKFLGHFVPVLALYGKRCGIVKNVCTIVRALWDGSGELRTLYNIWHHPEQSEKQNALWNHSVAQLFVNGFSLCLNGFGALDAIFGANMLTQHRLPPATWIFFGIGGTLSVIAGSRLKEHIDNASR